MHQSLQNIEFSKRNIQTYLRKYTTQSYEIDPKGILNYLLRKHQGKLAGRPSMVKISNWWNGQSLQIEQEKQFVNRLLNCKTDEVIKIINDYLEQLYHALPEDKQKKTKMPLPHSSLLFALLVSYFYYFSDMYELNLQKNSYFKFNIMIPCHLAKKNRLEHYKKLTKDNEPNWEASDQTTPSTPDNEQRSSFKNAMDLYKTTQNKDISLLYYIANQIINTFNNPTKIEINVPDEFQLTDLKARIYAFIRIEAALNSVCSSPQRQKFIYYLATLAVEYDATIQNEEIMMKLPIFKDLNFKLSNYLQGRKEVTEENENQDQTKWFKSLEIENFRPVFLCKDVAEHISNDVFPLPTLKK